MAGPESTAALQIHPCVSPPDAFPERDDVPTHPVRVPVAVCTTVKRAFIVREIWQTEKAYVESLRFMHEVGPEAGSL